MKRVLCLLLSAMIIISSMGVITFADNNHWSYDYIKGMLESGVVTGDQNGNLNLDNFITRAEFAKTVNKYFGYTVKANQGFNDVAQGTWYYDDMLIAKGTGYMIGDANGNANPDSKITRAEVFVIMARLLNLDDTEPTFADRNEIPDWAKGKIGALHTAGKISGYEDGTIRANGNITRAEAFVTVAKNERNFLPADAEVEELGNTSSMVNKGGVSIGGGGGPSSGGGGPSGTVVTPAATISGIVLDTASNNLTFKATNAASFDIQLVFAEPSYTYSVANITYSLNNGVYTVDMTPVIRDAIFDANSKTPSIDIYNKECTVLVKANGNSGYATSGYIEVTKKLIATSNKFMSIEKIETSGSQYIITVKPTEIGTPDSIIVKLNGASGNYPPVELSLPVSSDNTYTFDQSNIGVDGLVSVEVIAKSGDTIIDFGKMEYKVVNLTGSGTETDPYIIASEDQFMLIADNLSAYYKQVTDIKVDNMFPIDMAFSGNYDGNGKAITVDFEVTMTDEKTATGLFPIISKGTVKNLTVKGSMTVNGSAKNMYAGGITGGLKNAGKIENCVNYANITMPSGTSTSRIGGIVGDGHTGAGSSKITNCINYGELNGGAGVTGGIVAVINSDTVLSNCGNFGKVTSTTKASGICPWCYKAPVSCYNFGDITGATASGIAGDASASNAIVVKNCFNAGTVTGSTAAAAIAYSSYNASSPNKFYNVENCYNIVKGLDLMADGAEEVRGTATNSYNVTATDAKATAIIKEFLKGKISISGFEIVDGSSYPYLQISSNKTPADFAWEEKTPDEIIVSISVENTDIEIFEGTNVTEEVVKSSIGKVTALFDTDVLLEVTDYTVTLDNDNKKATVTYKDKTVEINWAIVPVPRPDSLTVEKSTFGVLEGIEVTEAMVKENIGKVTAVFADHSEVITNYTVAIDSANKKATITYGEVSIEIVWTVIPAEVTEITVEKDSFEVEFGTVVTEAIIKENIGKVTALYNNDTSKEITDFTVEVNTSSNKATVSYEGKTAEITWTEKDPVPTQVATSLKGSGTVSDPYLITNAGEFVFAFSDDTTFTGDLSEVYYITNDIDLRLAINAFKPNVTKVFKGKLIGVKSENDFTPYKRTINLDEVKSSGKVRISSTTGSYNCGGIFAEAEGATLSHLVLEGQFTNTAPTTPPQGATKVSGSTGALVGYAFGATKISYIDNYCLVTGGKNQTGGIVGYLYGSSDIENSTNFASVTGKGDSVGGIVGCEMASSGDTAYGITNCANYGVVTNENGDAGGITGKAYMQVIGCVNRGSVTAIGDGKGAGGIVGYHCQKTLVVSQCANLADVTGANAGGIVGRGYGGDGARPYAISDCYNLGQITGTKVGAAVGNSQKNNVTIKNFYDIANEGIKVVGAIDSANKSTETNVYVAGTNATKPEIKSYFNITGWQTSGSYEYPQPNALFTNGLYNKDSFDGSAGDDPVLPPQPQITLTGIALENNSFEIEEGTEVTESLIKEKVGKVTATYSDTSTKEVTSYTVSIDAANKKATITYEDKTADINWTVKESAVEDDTLIGEGTEGSPYLISNKAQFARISENTAAYYKQTKDIIGLTQWISDEFSGSYDGDGHTIDVNFVYDGTADSLGLFKILSGTVKNLTITGTVINNNSKNGTAAFVGRTKGNKIVIENCINYADVTTKNVDQTAGIVGRAYGDSSKGVVRNCKNYGTITANHASGIIGVNTNTVDVTGCANFGEVNGGVSAAGICTWVYGNIYNSYNLGKVSASVEGATVYGIAGKLQTWNTSYNSKIENCFNAGQLEATYTFGIAGRLIVGTASVAEQKDTAKSNNKKGPYTIKNCYNIVDAVCPVVDSLALMTGLPTADNIPDKEWAKINASDVFYTTNLDDKVDGTSVITKDELKSKAISGFEIVSTSSYPYPQITGNLIPTDYNYTE